LRYDRDVTDDGMAKLSGKVTVRFDRDFVLAPSKTPLVSSFEVSLPAEQARRPSGSCPALPSEARPTRGW